MSLSRTTDGSLDAIIQNQSVKAGANSSKISASSSIAKQIIDQAKAKFCRKISIILGQIWADTIPLPIIRSRRNSPPSASLLLLPHSQNADFVGDRIHLEGPRVQRPGRFAGVAVSETTSKRQGRHTRGGRGGQGRPTFSANFFFF